MQVCDRIELKGKSKHGKNRIQQFGTEWMCTDIRERIHTTTHQRLAGPFAMIVSSTGDFRWIAVKDDPDFIVQECVE
tara:strand:- start:2422 stop:2652 length:231 start_codon:yes stop_codon:yes gene_type:complete